MKSDAKHEVPCPRHDCLNRAFCSCILMLGANSREELDLILLATGLPELLRRKDAAVAAIMLHFNECKLPKPRLRVGLEANMFASSQQHLISNLNWTSSSIIQNGATVVAVVGTFPAISWWQLAGSSNNILIHRNKIPGKALACGKNALLVFGSLRLLDFGVSFLGLCQLKNVWRGIG